jgi:hypothetical protein
MGLSPTNWLGLCQVSVSHIQHVIENSSSCTITYVNVLCHYRIRRADHAFITYLMLQRQFNRLNGRKLNHRQGIGGLTCPVCNISARTTYKTPFLCCSAIVAWRWDDAFKYSVSSHRSGLRRKQHSSVVYVPLTSNARLLCDSTILPRSEYAKKFY